ncbi:YidX family protein [Psychrobacter sanguinis]|uniref:hypothetical protein n=1 Tax=Psychrobacter sanguinis TaxID=861445 RepID=UPI00191ACAEC|nr:hypothetical protein [Psychrobacter sanguinis]MCC3307798.1 hypothetical protein [Psychrobacter sanguinis]UEC25095.1 hypothetical protein LK453_11255 [Psychrobacter sanguinis]
MNKSETKWLKILAMACTGFGAIILPSCSVYSTNSVQSQSQSIFSSKANQPMEVEVIRHIGYPTDNGVRQKGSVLIGDHHSYLISTGSDALTLLTELPSKNLHIQQPIRINRYSDNSVHIDLKFNYQKTSGSYSENERAIFSQICPTSLTTSLSPSLTGTSLNNNSHNTLNSTLNNTLSNPQNTCQLTLQGGMYAPISQANLNNSSIKKDANLKLDQGLTAEIYTINSKRARTPAEIAVIPWKVVVETLELPLEILSIFK